MRMNLREEILEIIDSGVSCDDDYPYYIGDPIDEIIKVIEKRIDRIIEEEKERMLTQGHSFSSDYGIQITEIPVDKVKEMLK